MSTASVTLLSPRCQLPMAMAAVLFFTGLLGYWEAADEAVFRWLDDRLLASREWARWVAITNQRGVDFLIGGLMATVVLVEFFRRTGIARARVLATIPIMGLTFVAITAIGHALPVEARLSPTLEHDSAVRVSQWFPDIATKDHSPSSFPSDHAIGVLTFLLFAWRAFPGPHLWLSMPLLLLLMTPRFLVGAHWLSDLLCGSLPLVLLAWSLLFQTGWLDRLLDAGLATAVRWLQRFGLLGTAAAED